MYYEEISYRETSYVNIIPARPKSIKILVFLSFKWITKPRFWNLSKIPDFQEM